ncbi:MAG: DNA-3-methyladenine glycosylase [Oligoflexia bacterium]|nr:DNA-3-methyladenine glycosylase [Oligoflexia bacterium]
MKNWLPLHKSTLQLARALLGVELVTRINGVTTSGIIVEVEAYCGPHDSACHSAVGRTKRTEVMFWAAGHCYVYFIYGNHFCVNVVTEPEGIGAAVLIRALAPKQGLPVMRSRRARARNEIDLTNGPGKLCQALGISMRELGENLLTSTRIFLRPGKPVDSRNIGCSPRIGITHNVSKPWRFFIIDNPFVSRGPKADKSGVNGVSSRNGKRSGSQRKKAQKRTKPASG